MQAGLALHGLAWPQTICFAAWVPNAWCSWRSRCPVCGSNHARGGVAGSGRWRRCEM